MPTATAAAETVQSSGASGGAAVALAAATPNTLPAPGELLSPGQLEELLAGLPLSDLNVSQLAEYLAGLPEIEVLAGLQVGLGESTLGLEGLEESLTKAIEALGPSATIGELVQISGLLPLLETELNGLLGTLLGGALTSEAQEELAGALQTLNLDQLVGALLATAGEPEQLSGLSELAGGLFEELGAGNVEELLGTPLEAPFTPTTVEGAAEQLGTTAQAVSGELGQTSSELPATATMLTAPVGEGKLLAVAPAVKGLAVSLLGGGEEEGGPESEEKGGSKEGSGSGEGTGSGSGNGSGGNTTPAPGGAGGSTGPLTVVINVPPTTTGTAAGSGRAKTNAAKLRVLGVSTHGAHATVVLQVPAAGRLALRGSGIRERTLVVRRAGRYRVRVGLSRAGIAARHRHRGHLRVALHVSFRGAAGAGSAATGSTATAVLAFR